MKFVTMLGIAVLSAVSNVRAGSFPSRPYIPGGPFEITVDVSPPGLESFVLTGQAFDDNPEDILTMSASTRYFLRFEFAPGNPAILSIAGSISRTERSAPTGSALARPTIRHS